MRAVVRSPSRLPLAAVLSAAAVALLLLALPRASPLRRRPPVASEMRPQQAAAPVEGALLAEGESTMAVLIAHEIKQPLSAILANVDAAGLLWKQAPLPAEEVGSILTDIRADVLLIKQILHKLRTLLAKSSLDATVLELNEVVAASKGLLGSLARHHHTRLQLDLAPDLWPVVGDSTYLQQLLVNLATNGMEAMSTLPPSRRNLRLKTERGERGTVAITVSDNGPGIAVGQLPEIFKLFYSTKPQGAGGRTGMGLAVVKTIVDAHGGTIEVESHEGAGTVFRVLLPTIGAARRREVSGTKG